MVIREANGEICSPLFYWEEGENRVIFLEINKLTKGDAS